MHGKPTYSNPVTYRGSRPDSKSLNPYPNLPPIEANRGKNQRSTVFEKEAWIPPAEPEPKLSTVTEYKQQYETGRPNSERYEPTYQNNNNYSDVYLNGERKAYSETGAPTMERSFKDSMLQMLPPEPFLPSDPVKYTSDQRQRLLDTTAEEMRGVTTDRLKGAYHLLSRIDRQLNGLCQFENVKDILRQERVSCWGLWHWNIDCGFNLFGNHPVMGPFLLWFSNVRLESRVIQIIYLPISIKI